MEKEYDFIAIGDTVVDDFIRLSNAHVNCKVDSTNCEICMAFGSKVPFEFSKKVYAVGNSANASVAIARLGLKSGLITNIGDDQNGELCLSELSKNNVSTEFVKKNNDKKTNFHYVLWFLDERTILIKHELFDYKMPNVGSPKFLYLSSLGENSLDFHYEIAKYLEEHKEIKLVFQPGTFQIKFGYEKLKDIYKRTHLFFLNKEEAETILQIEEKDIKILLKKINELGPEIVVITDGANGAYAFHNGKYYFAKPFPDTEPPKERTGAGDAYASTITGALLLGKNIDEAMLYASVNSMSVVQFIGAQEGLLSKEKIEEYLSKAPSDYKVVEI